MDTPLYLLARLLIAGLQKLPLRWVARLGRLGGGLVFWFDRRHRRVALANLNLCLGREKSAVEIRELAHENFRRIGENFASAVKTASMTLDELAPHIEFAAAPEIHSSRPEERPEKIVAAIGHFGNFELYARFGQFFRGYKTATTYRGLRQASLNGLLQALRNQSGCLFFERRFETAALKAYMNQPEVILGLLADQHAGPRGLRLPFMGVECSTSAAPALFALRYSAALYPGICYRVGLAKWRIEGGSRIPTHGPDGRARSPKEIMLDVNRAFDAAVRKDPANWFWVHNRWKGRDGKPVENLAGANSADNPEPAAEVR